MGAISLTYTYAKPAKKERACWFNSETFHL
jgi:hypothetical protein